MKTVHIFGISLLFITLVFALAAIANFDQSRASAQNLSAASFSRQITSHQITTPTPPTENVSEVGSTDGIVIMGIVIVIAVMVPLLFRKKKRN